MLVCLGASVAAIVPASGPVLAKTTLPSNPKALLLASRPAAVRMGAVESHFTDVSHEWAVGFSHAPISGWRAQGLLEVSFSSPVRSRERYWDPQFGRFTSVLVGGKAANRGSGRWFCHQARPRPKLAAMIAEATDTQGVFDTDASIRFAGWSEYRGVMLRIVRVVQYIGPPRRSTVSEQFRVEGDKHTFRSPARPTVSYFWINPATLTIARITREQSTILRWGSHDAVHVVQRSWVRFSYGGPVHISLPAACKEE
jgi:hypothetical protein